MHITDPTSSKRYQGLTAQEIISLKRQRKQRPLEEQRVREEMEKQEQVCKRCGAQGHKDARSRECPYNKSKKRTKEDAEKKRDANKRRKLEAQGRKTDPCKKCTDEGIYDPEAILTPPDENQVVHSMKSYLKSIFPMNELPNIFFSQQFFYACQQLVLGKPVTNTNLPIAQMTRIFEEQSTTIPCMKISPHSANQSIIYANVLAYQAQQSATIFINNIVEPFANRAKRYLFVKIRMLLPDLDERQAWRFAAYIYSCITPNPTDWPEGVDHTADLDFMFGEILESTDLPLSLLVTEENLTRNPGPFFKFLDFALSVIELYNDQKFYAACEPQSEATLRWLYTTIFNTCEELQRTRKSRRRKLALAILQLD
ncbi:uncharacterized protein BYT42DRAFT_609779 [Radiomyces spectabilis]|uniref:uncharacterized protein n=1 Tax=Radiomyces spectabilis TaxID=64574 RepID=UPI00221F47A4|nr:uncharacterized protein BYT42DRAFT_609779 [Radiomyces spectabilis]KAI8394019.1 hypothetical protein BYT42DRAFT_609779 [Radiomyces spectabilis]